MRVFIIFLIFISSLWTSCENQSTENRESLKRFAENYQIEPVENVSSYLFLPLSGCEIYIDPLLNYMKNYWQCTEIDENARMVLSADWPKQLRIMTNYTKESIPDCIIYDSVNVAYFNGLVFNAPVGYEKNEENEVKKIDPGSKEWSRFLKDYFKISIVEVD